MKRLFAILFFLVSFSMYGYSYVWPTWSWGYSFNGQIKDLVFYDDYVYTLGTFSDSSFILGTDTITNHGGSDVMIIKWDTYGNIVWAKSIYGSQNEFGNAIKVNSNNELVIIGDYTSPNIIIGSDTIISNGASDIYIAKYDLNGNFVDANNYGTAGNEYAFHMFLDYEDNIYIMQNSDLKKYNPSGVLLTSFYLPGGNPEYSAFDSTIVCSGEFATTLGYGADTINAVNVLNEYKTDIFLAKTKLDGTPLWIKNVTNMYYDQNNDAININETNGNIYLGYNSTGGLNGPSINLRQISPSGSPLNWYSSQDVLLAPRYLISLSRKDSIISMMEIASGMITLWLINLNSNNLIVDYINGSEQYFPYFQLLQDEKTIYTVGRDFHNYKDCKFGRIGSDILAYIGPSSQTIHHCLGDTATLNGNVYFGLGPKIYNWAPAIGLNNTNTNTVSFTAVSNITYTLTVTDSTGHIKRDTFNIIIDTLLSAPTLTSQFPAFCSDSMLLYSNLGVGGTWKKFNPILNTWGTPFLSNSINATIYSAGKYLILSENSCGMVSDTIDIMPVVTVIANTSQDTLCSGQSVTLYGTGALSYVWSGGVIDSIPFTPLSTQIYTVTGTDANGCNNTSSINIVVNPTPVIGNIKALPNSFCSMGNAVLSFETNTQYCVPTVQYPGGIRCISNFNFNGINNNTGLVNGNYTYYNLTPIVVAGLSYPSSLTVSGGTETYRRIWIDFNHDGDFDDLNEMVFSWWGTNTTNSNILIPLNAVNGITRMRVACRDMAIYGPPPTACNNDNYGEYEDYNLNITGGTAIPNWSPNTFLNTNVGNNIQVTNINTTTTYTVAITNLYGCSNSDSVTITVGNPSSSSFDTSICFYSIPYLWNGQSIFASGTYTHLATNSVGCDSTATIHVKVNELQNVTITPTSDTAICSGSHYTLFADTGFVNYQWEVNSNIISTSNTISVNTGGNYVLTCIDTNGCWASDIVHVDILPLPAPILTYADYYLKCSNVANVSYQWFQDDQLLDDSDSMIYIAHEGIYKVMVKDSNGCLGNDIFKIGSELLTSTPNDISLFPNPSSGKLTINYVLSDSLDVSIILFDINGRAVHSFLIDNLQQKGFHRHIFDLDKLGIETGVYFFRIKLGLDTYIKKLLYH